MSHQKIRPTKRPDGAGMICSGPLLSFPLRGRGGHLPQKGRLSIWLDAWLRSAHWGRYPVAQIRWVVD